MLSDPLVFLRLNALGPRQDSLFRFCFTKSAIAPCAALNVYLGFEVKLCTLTFGDTEILWPLTFIVIMESLSCCLLFLLNQAQRNTKKPFYSLEVIPLFPECFYGTEKRFGPLLFVGWQKYQRTAWIRKRERHFYDLRLMRLNVDWMSSAALSFSIHANKSTTRTILPI